MEVDFYNFCAILNNKMDICLSISDKQSEENSGAVYLKNYLPKKNSVSHCNRNHLFLHK